MSERSRLRRLGVGTPRRRGGSRTTPRRTGARWRLRALLSISRPQTPEVESTPHSNTPRSAQAALQPQLHSDLTKHRMTRRLGPKHAARAQCYWKVDYVLQPVQTPARVQRMRCPPQVEQQDGSSWKCCVVIHWRDHAAWDQWTCVCRQIKMQRGCILRLFM
jgi:hypothetical protein